MPKAPGKKERKKERKKKETDYDSTSQSELRSRILKKKNFGGGGRRNTFDSHRKDFFFFKGILNFCLAHRVLIQSIRGPDIGLVKNELYPLARSYIGYVGIVPRGECVGLAELRFG